ncbi:thioredoxin family protein [Treponema sp. OMZ 840]|uniref:thioredoxin family protein n=1 Tax=Treponema sp. OMZ 840 TaxID=244313 RepID=UPI003D91AB23
MAVKEISADMFEKEVLKSTKPVLVDFYAPWCGDCRRIMPALDAIAEANAERFDIIKVNTDKAPALSETYAVKALPTLLVFKNGTHGSRITEPSSKNEIDQWLKGELQ